MHPWYRGFIGTITPKPGKERGSYVVTGTFQRLDETTIEVTELPVKKWTQVRLTKGEGPPFRVVGLRGPRSNLVVVVMNLACL